MRASLWLLHGLSQEVRFAIQGLLRLGATTVFLAAPTFTGYSAVPDKGALVFDSMPHARFEFAGPLGQRIRVNGENWLLQAPQANPGLLEMFRLRDREPAPKLVPWAGEFVGKYLISAIQALRLSDNPALRLQVREVITELVATQAEDGYLGPFPKAIRLKANWDLWAHYHCLLALLMWHEATGDAAALACARRAADLTCATFLNTGKRVFDVGDHEMNMAMIHGLGWLHRLTGEGRYLEMMREIEKDWERAGDYYRAGLSGQEFFQTPRPRWESLHDLQGLVELYRITGEPKYRTAFEHHWRSICRWDRRNNGGFSSGEQATGNPYANTAIETCCTIAWMALTLDMLKLTGDARVADELELSTFNAAAGAQHPSGRWWTYNTPMDGAREASAHSIVFQARAGTPELNCCSVNGPRGLGVLSEWAVMTAPDGLVVNYYGPGRFEGRLADGTPLTIRWETQYPREGKVRLALEPGEPREFNLRLRIPAWTQRVTAKLNNTVLQGVMPGSYLEVRRPWQKGDVVELEFDLAFRFVPGANEAAQRVSIYRGPILLTYDQRYNDFDESAIPPIDPRRLGEGRVVPSATASDQRSRMLQPWLLVDLPMREERRLRLCDFASAGAAGTRYRSWLAAAECPPPPVVTQRPADGASVPSAGALFQWRGPKKTNAFVAEYRLQIAATPDFTQPIVDLKGLSRNRLALEAEAARNLSSGGWYFWRVLSVNAHGASESSSPPARFRIDPSLKAEPEPPAEVVEGPGGVLVKASLRGGPKPEFGRLKSGSAFQPAAGPGQQPGTALELSGEKQMLVYELGEFPEEDYSVTVRMRISELPGDRLGQIFSAWSRPMDDPLRLCVQQGKLFARIEAGQGYSTGGVIVEPGRWYHIAAVKRGERLLLYVDGQERASATVPLLVSSSANDFALGGNPHFTGNEFLAVQLADFAFFARALSAVEVAERAAARGL